MSIDSGFITAEEILNHLRLTARTQNGSECRNLKNGLQIPPFAIADHILFNGLPVFYPGTWGTGDDQGDGGCGHLPPVDDHYEFVHIAYYLMVLTGKIDFLNEVIDGRTILERLTLAFESPESDKETGMVTTRTGRRAVGFGFCDTIHLAGAMLFPSILRYRAAAELAAITEKIGDKAASKKYLHIGDQIRKNLPQVFKDPEAGEGWLIAATECCRQPDVWGTIYAIYMNLLEGEVEAKALKTILDRITDGSIICEGALRHVPVGRDYSSQSAWEKTLGIPINQYQNGAFWHTPIGWLIAVLAKHNPKLANKIFKEYIASLKADDFRKDETHGSPWECFYRPANWQQNPVYMASVALPYSALKTVGDK
jgi:hypothetical protein